MDESLNAVSQKDRNDIENELFKHISKLADIMKNSTALNYGDFSTILLTNKQCVIKRCVDTETVLVCINADENNYYANFNVSANYIDLLTNKELRVENGFEMKAYSSYILKLV